MQKSISRCRDLQVQLLISDDSGIKENKYIYDKYIGHTFFDLLYIETSGSIGFEKNFFELAKNAKGQYIFFLGEDDFVSEFFFLEINELIKRSEDLFLVNYYYMNNLCNLYNPRSVFGPKYKINVSSLIKNEFYKLGFMGSFVMRKSIFDIMMAQVPLDTWFPHINIIMRYLLNSEVLTLRITEPIVFNRAENSESFTWSHKALENLIGYRIAFFEPHKKSYDSKKLKNIGLINFGFLELYSFKKILAVKAKSDSKTFEMYKTHWIYFFKFRLYLFFASFLPKTVLKALVKIINKNKSLSFIREIKY